MSNPEGNLFMSDEIFEMKLEFFLRSTGRLFPITPAQVEAFETMNPKPPASTIQSDPLAILERGYRHYTLPSTPLPISKTETEEYRWAARNGRKISPETLRKMRDDREKDQIK